MGRAMCAPDRQSPDPFEKGWPAWQRLRNAGTRGIGKDHRFRGRMDESRDTCFRSKLP